MQDWAKVRRQTCHPTAAAVTPTATAAVPAATVVNPITGAATTAILCLRDASSEAQEAHLPVDVDVQIHSRPEKGVV